MHGRRALIALAVVALAIPVALQWRHMIGTGAYSGPRRPGVCRVAQAGNVVALTFDDGPSRAYTRSVLGILDAEGARATFFLVGRNAAAHPGLVRDEELAGMEIGSHTWSHPRLADLGPGQVREQLGRTQSALDAQRARPRLFRAPFGLLTPDQLSLVRSLGLRPVHWSIALDHYVGGMGLDPAHSARRLLDELRPGDIILAHDAGGDRAETLATLRLLLPQLRRRAWEVTTVGTLLSRGQPVSAAPRPWFWQSGFYCP